MKQECYKCNENAILRIKFKKDLQEKASENLKIYFDFCLTCKDHCDEIFNIFYEFYKDIK